MKKLIFCIAILAVSSNAIAWDRGYKEYYNRSNQYQGYSMGGSLYDNSGRWLGDYSEKSVGPFKNQYLNGIYRGYSTDNGSGFRHYYNEGNQYQGYSTTPFADDDEEDEDSW